MFCHGVREVSDVTGIVKLLVWWAKRFPLVDSSVARDKSPGLFQDEDLKMYIISHLEALGYWKLEHHWESNTAILRIICFAVKFDIVQWTKKVYWTYRYSLYVAGTFNDCLDYLFLLLSHEPNDSNDWGKDVGFW